MEEKLNPKQKLLRDNESPDKNTKKNFSKSFNQDFKPTFKRPKYIDSQGNMDKNKPEEYTNEDFLIKEEEKERARSFSNVEGPQNYYIEDNIFTLFNPLDLVGKDKGTSIKERKTSSIATIFSIWSCMIGSGLLSLPWAVKEAGLIPTLIICFIYGLINFYTCYIYVKTGLHAKDFSDTVAEYFGKRYGFYGRSIQIIGNMLISLGALFCLFLIVK